MSHHTDLGFMIYLGTYKVEKLYFSYIDHFYYDHVSKTYYNTNSSSNSTTSIFTYDEDDCGWYTYDNGDIEFNVPDNSSIVMIDDCDISILENIVLYKIFGNI